MLHAAMRLPALTPQFSDVLAVTQMTLTPGGNVVLTTAAPHGVATGQPLAIAITDAGVPNRIVEAVVQEDDTLRLVTEHDHDFTTAPPGFDGDAWDSFVTLQGFGNLFIDGQRQLAAAPDRRTLIVQPGGSLGDVSETPTSAVLERLPGSVIGWHRATASGASTLTFPAGADVTRAMTVLAPTVVRNIRCWGALDLNTARSKFVIDDNKIDIGACHLFVVPVPSVRTGRSRHAKTDAIAELSPAVELRQSLIDGFTVLVFVPAKTTSGGVSAADLCHGPLFTAMLRTFNGLNLPRPELVQGDAYCALFASHGAVFFGGGVYVHAYEFQAPGVLTNADAIAPHETAALTPGVTPTDVVPIGAPAFRDIDFTGILHDSQPQPLIGTVSLEPDDT